MQQLKILLYTLAKEQEIDLNMLLHGVSHCFILNEAFFLDRENLQVHLLKGFESEEEAIKEEKELILKFKPKGNQEYLEKVERLEIHEDHIQSYKEEIIKIDISNLSGKAKAMVGRIPNFRDLCSDYIKDIEDGISTEFYEHHNEIFLKLKTLYPNVNSRIDIIRSACGQHKNLVNLLDTAYIFSKSEDALKTFLNLKEGQFYPTSTIKERVTKFYNDNNIRKTPKATIIESLYSVKKSTKNINNEKINGYVIL